MTINRRRFLQLSSLASASFLVPQFLSSCVSKSYSNKKLVVIQLSGGNDGLNTVVPFRNDIYYKSRPTIALKQNELITLTDDAGLHPALKNLRRIYDKGYVSILNNVGYPEPSRSHFKSMDIWHSGYTAQGANTGWLGRYMDTCCKAGGKTSSMGLEMDETGSLALRGTRKEGYSKTVLEGGRARKGTEYPDTQIGNHLKIVADQIKSEADTRICYVSHGSFDTHVNQNEHQGHLLGEFDGGLGAFVTEMERERKLQDVMVLVFSEFGRRVAENPLKGTDHGAANNVFVVGGGLKQAGMYNELPDLGDLNEGDIKHTMDFREVYATVLDKWLDGNANDILGEEYQQLSII